MTDELTHREAAWYAAHRDYPLFPEPKKENNMYPFKNLTFAEWCALLIMVITIVGALVALFGGAR